MKRLVLATVAVACIFAVPAFAADDGVKAQIASERKGNAQVFETALAATEAKKWISPTGGTLPYRLHVPAKPEPGKLYPLVIHMHGAGSWGTNNVDQIKTGGADFISWAKRHGEEYVFIAPQTPKRYKWVDTPWENKKSTMKETPTPSLRMAMEIIDDAVARYPIDRNRIYVMGISMGGYAAWELLQRRPELFAAGLPCCGGGDVAQAPRLKNVASEKCRDMGVPRFGGQGCARLPFARHGRRHQGRRRQEDPLPRIQGARTQRVDADVLRRQGLRMALLTTTPPDPMTRQLRPAEVGRNFSLRCMCESSLV